MEGWSTINWNDVVVKVSSSKSVGFDKFSLDNYVDLVLRILKTDVLWVIFEKCVKEPPPLLVKNAFDLIKQAQTAKVLPSKIKKPFNQKQELFNSLVVSWNRCWIFILRVCSKAKTQTYWSRDTASPRYHRYRLENWPFSKAALRTWILESDPNRTLGADKI